MKLLPLFLTLVMISACGGKKHHHPKPVIEVTEDGLSCDVGEAGQSAPTVKVEKDLLELIVRDLEGRPFSREEFWSRLHRNTRIELNIELNKQIKKIPEELVYKSIPLFVEHYQKNPEQSFYLRSGNNSVVFYSDEGSLKLPGGDCKETRVPETNLSHVIRESTLEKKLNCYGPQMHVEVSLYKNAVIFTKYFDAYVFSGAELIRTDVNGKVMLEGLAPDETTLTASISSGRVLEIRLVGTSGSIVGTGMCD